jgi:ssDNA-binding Zn-finger/Zn-ribbon topoisomerase 1
MVERESRKDASRFWGCAQFPKCKARLPMRVSA